MTENELKKLVNEAVSLHRALTTYGERLKTLKGELIREAKRHKEDFIITDGGGSRWSASGTDGCIARVNFPAPALLSHIATEDETFDKVIALAGESLDDLFESRHYLKPAADFREKTADALPRRTALQLIELCQVECSPRVSFETAETKTKERWGEINVRYKNNIGPQVRRRRYALGWSQSDLATKLQLAGFDISRSGVSKIEARLSYVDDKTMLYLAEVLKLPVQDLFPPRTPGNRIHDFIEKLETTRF